MSKKITKKSFATKARKGFVDVHIVVSVNDRGETEVHHADSRESMESAIQASGITFGDVAEYHHAVLTLPIPKLPKPKKVKAKKVTKAAAPKKKAVKKGSKGSFHERKASTQSRARAKRVCHSDATAAVQPAELNSDGTMPGEMAADLSAN